MAGISCDVYAGADDSILINVMKGGRMARFLIGTIPVVEHVSPVMAIAPPIELPARSKDLIPKFSINSCLLLDS